jgi:hypothetical protein
METIAGSGSQLILVRIYLARIASCLGNCNDKQNQSLLVHLFLIVKRFNVILGELHTLFKTAGSRRHM